VRTRPTGIRARVAVICVGASLLAISPLAAATTFPLPKPVSAKTLVTLVKSSTSITSTPSGLDPAIPSIPNDELGNTSYHASDGGCPTFSTACTYGKISSDRSVVLFGDTHAWMWLAAVAPEVARLGDKLQLIWKLGCPVAAIANHPEFPSDSGCSAWRTAEIAAIKREKPVVVLLAERTSDVYAPNGTTPITAAEWTAGLVSTISSLQGATTTIAVIGDDPEYDPAISPAVCLAHHRTTVQTCSTAVHNANRGWADNAPAEQIAARAEHATFIATTPWLCTTTACSEIVGTMAVYATWSDVSATYSAYLSGVMGTKIKSLI
jgi:hypothetical protein